MAAKKDDFAQQQSLLNKELKEGSFRRVYLLCGEEDYLKDYYANALQKALIPTGDTINLNRYSGKEADTGVLISQSETLPFFAERRSSTVV